MTSTPVSSVSTGFKQNAKSGSKSNVIMGAGDFQTLMSQSSKNETSQQAVKTQNKGTDPNTWQNKTLTNVKESEQNLGLKDKISETDSKTKELISEIAEEMQVSEEEVIAAMELLGFTLQDLTNQGNMAMLMSELSGEIDALALITDATLFAKVNDLISMISEGLGQLAEECNIPQDEMAELLKEAQTKLAEQNADFSVNEDADSIQQAEVNPMDENQGIHKKEVDTDKANVDNQSTQITPEKQIAVENNIQQEQDSGKGNREEHSSNHGETLAQMTNPLDNVDNMAFKDEPPIFTMDTEDILNQIGEYVKLNVKPGMTEMEISLHPESLGNVHLQVTAKNGMITAQITAQNEEVKQVLEAQVVQLRERLDAQGLKVEAVEVTIASHEFERNLEQNEQQKEQQASVKKATRKKLNLDDLEEEIAEENLTDADKIEIDMMERSGNRVSFMA